MKHRLIVVADLAMLKAYKLERNEINNSHRLELVHQVELSEAHQKLVDRLSDQAGRFGSAGAPGAASGERHNIELEHRKRLVKLLVEHMTTLLRQADIDTCYFAASKEINHKILELLPQELRAKITKNIPADLTKLGKAELLARFTASS